MSSFKRRDPVRAEHPLGARPSPSVHSVLTISTGIPSLDDILGGGLPLGHILLVLAPDPHTAYGELLQRHFIAQGLACGQSVCILDDSAMDLAMGCMWIHPSTMTSDQDETNVADAELSGVKIAWRYENMRQFQTSVVSSSQSPSDLYCVPLDLTCRIPETLVKSAVASGQLRCFGVSTESVRDPFEAAVSKVEDFLQEKAESGWSNSPLRLSIPSLGSPQWKDATPTYILRLLHALRAQLRGNESAPPRASALITLPSYLSDDKHCGPGWSRKLAWLTDGCITLRSFSSDPALTSMFPSHHGLVNIHMLPAPYTLVPASDKFSQLRGLSSFSSSATGGGENNLAFKCTRKRFIIETLHLDVEGGVSERRTTVPIVADMSLVEPKEVPGSTSAAEVLVNKLAAEPKPADMMTKKAKKTVTFHSDRPELYEF